MNAIRPTARARLFSLLALFFQFFLSATVFADDAEIYNTTSSADAGNANIIFLLDNSTSMGDCIANTTSCTDTGKRFFALRKAMATVLDQTNGLKDATKVALFTYGDFTSDVATGRLGATMLAPLRALSDKLPNSTKTHREYLLDWFIASGQTGDNRFLIANKPVNFTYDYNTNESSMELRSYTPLETAYAEIGKYLQGKQAATSGITYFTQNGIIKNSTTPIKTLDVCSTAKPLTATNNYVKPDYSVSDASCAPPSWHVILVTDGEPTGETTTNRLPFFQDAIPAAQRVCTGALWQCSKELAAYLASSTVVDQIKSWECVGDCTYRDRNGDQQTADEPSLDSCTTNNATTTVNISDNKIYNWECRANYLWSNWTNASCSTDTNLAGLCDAAHANSSKGDFTGTKSTCISTASYGFVRGSSNSCTTTPYVTTCDASTENKCQSDKRTKCTKTLSYGWDSSGINGGSCATASTATCASASDVNKTQCSGSCQGSTCSFDSYAWACTGSTGGSCSDADTNKPGNRSCNSSGEVGDTRNSSVAVEKAISWRCKIADGTTHVYHNKLATNGTDDVVINTNAIFVGTDLGAGEAALRAVTTNGGGDFYNSTSVDQLAADLVHVVTRAEKQPNSISAPGVAVNQLSRFQHLDQLYYSVFKPEAKALWEGNLKRYWLNKKIIKDALSVEAVNPSTQFFKVNAHSCWGDIASGTLLTDPDCYGHTGDGADATLGGVRSKVDDSLSSRTVLTTIDNSTVQSFSTALTAAADTLTTKAALMGYCATCTGSQSYNNGAITALGATADTQLTRFNALVSWGSGQRASDKTNTMLVGDPLHSQPVLVNYGFVGDDATGDTRETNRNAAMTDGSKQDNYVFFSTNAGALHAIKASTGEEEFSYVPKEMLPLVPKTETIPSWAGTGSRLYGLDGSWVSWRHDANSDGDVKDTGDWVYLYGGMRMGGSNYYALNVTNITSPTIKWTINGPLAGGYATGTDSSSNPIVSAVRVATPPASGPFMWLGQTWSEPVLAKVALKNSSGNEAGRTVLIFGGGYDPANETVPPATSAYGTDAYGHQLYIVDAKTGVVLFWAGGGSATYGSYATAISETPTLTVTDMKYSVTGSPVPVDRDGDGYIDLIYFADLGGQVFRVDLKNKGTYGAVNNCSVTTTTPCGDMVLRVAKIASFGEAAATSNSMETQRRFFESPGVAILQRPDDNTQYMSIAIGSGNRAHPAYKGTRDRVFVFTDSSALLSSLNGISVTTVTETNLQDVTSYVSYASDGYNKFTGKSGFYIDVSTPSGTGMDGEKVFSTPLIFQGVVKLTTYVPESASSASDLCSAGTGSSSLYEFSVFDGRSELDGAATLIDRDKKGISKSMTGDVQTLLSGDDGGEATDLAGTYVKDAKYSNKGLRRTRWYEKPHY